LNSAFSLIRSCETSGRTRRQYLCHGFDGFERAAGDVFPVEGDHIALSGKLGELGAILEFTDERGRNLSARGVFCAV
jgi:hypothetical protein